MGCRWTRVSSSLFVVATPSRVRQGSDVPSIPRNASFIFNFQELSQNDPLCSSFFYFLFWLNLKKKNIVEIIYNL